MKKQVELEKFRNEIERLIRSSEKEYGEKPGAESQSHHYHDLYQTIAVNILKHVIEPRMEIVARQFDDASLDVNTDVGYARLSFLHKELPAAIYLLFCLRLDYSARVIRLYSESCLKAFSFDYEPTATFGLTLEEPDLKRVEAFIEEQISKFIQGYLRARHYWKTDPRQ